MLYMNIEILDKTLAIKYIGLLQFLLIFFECGLWTQIKFSIPALFSKVFPPILPL